MLRERPVFGLNYPPRKMAKQVVSSACGVGADHTCGHIRRALADITGRGGQAIAQKGIKNGHFV